MMSETFIKTVIDSEIEVGPIENDESENGGDDE